MKPFYFLGADSLLALASSANSDDGDEQNGLELHGSACQQVKGATETKVAIIFGCRGVPIK